MRVLVTGSNGFSGRHLVRDLAARGHDVVALSRGAPADALPPGVRHARADLIDAGRALEGPFDAVVHAAGTSPVPGTSVAHLTRDNVEGTRALLDAAAAWKAGAFVLFSSLSANGRIDAAVVDESTPVRDPDPYGLTKLLCEAMLAERAAALPGLIYRLPAIVGPGAARNWPANAAAAIARGAPVRCFSPEAAFNNALHVADLCALTAAALEKGWRGTRTLLPAPTGETTVRGALTRLAAAIGRELALEIVPAPKKSFLLSGARAAASFGHAPMHIDEVLDRYGGEVKTGAR